MAKQKKTKVISPKQQRKMTMHADYLARQEVAQTPFGKGFKTGPSKNKKKYTRKAKHRASLERGSLY
jgi:hypothetical protein